MSLVVKHEFKAADEEKSVVSNKEAIICVGSTGTGKSSLIKLYCGDNVVVGHHTQSQTINSTLFQESKSNDRYWLDSQGANCSSGTNDAKVLTDILKKLYDEKINKIKVIWCVSGDMCREKQEFQLQATFIQSLGDNIWNSCLIIKKKGKPKPKKMNGVLAAANRYGANINAESYNNLFGFKGLEYGDNSDDDTLELLNETADINERKKKYKKYGYFTNEQIITEVNQKLAQLSSISIEFEIKICSKCGIKGDPRFVYAPCHGQSQQYHPQVLRPYHSGSLNWKHVGVIKQVAIEGIEWYHPRDFSEAGVGTVLAHTFTFGISTGIKAINGTLEGYYPCCDKGIKGSGCNSRKVITGHEPKWSCCDRASAAPGCRQQYQCCDRTTNDPGCKRKYSCCDQNEEITGCQKRCQSCLVSWGSGPGCTHETQ